MARIRTIKPDFFTSEDVVSLSPLARLLYVATWLEADREGRLVWRPKTLKLRYLPGDQCDIEELAEELITAGLVVPYLVDGQTFAEIPTFAKHQVINNRESASTIPPRVHDASATRDAPVDDATTTPLMGKEGKGKERKELTNADALVVAGKPAPCPHQKIIELYGKHLPNLPIPRIWDGQRKQNLAARWRWVLTAKKPDGAPYATDAESALGFFDRFFSYVSRSDFLTGRGGKWQGCDLGWLVKAENFAKVVSGNYENKEVA